MSDDEERTELYSRGPAERFGPYRVLDSLGRGGMGEVHLAVHAPVDGIERVVALKRLRADLGGNPRFVQMFLDEMRIAARIAHPNVCRVLSAGRIEGVPYLAMDLLSGVSLSELVQHARASNDPALRTAWPLVVCRIGADACEGLHAAHELRGVGGKLLNVVHRDVSPDNLFVGFDGVTRVIDFGIASAKEKLHRTVTGELRGKIAYTSPERIAAEPVDRRADLFSLGASLWEAAAFRPLFSHDDVGAAMRAIRQGLVPPLRDAQPDALLDLDAILAQSLAVDPARRFQTARAMGEALLDVITNEGQTVAAPQVAAWMDRLFMGAHERQVRALSHALSIAKDPSPGVEPRSPSSPADGLAARPQTIAFIAGALALGVAIGGAIGFLAGS